MKFNRNNLRSVFLLFAEESMLMKARNFGNKEHYRKAQKIETPSCEKFEDFKTTGRF